MCVHVRVDILQLARSLVRLDPAARDEVEGLMRVLAIPSAEQDRACRGMSSREKSRGIAPPRWDRTYPNTPVLFPRGTHALQMAFIDTVSVSVGMPLTMNVIHRESLMLNPVSRDYVEDVVRAWFGKPADELVGEQHWKSAEEALRKVMEWLNANGPGMDNLLLGDRVCFADLQLAALLLWTRVTLGAESEEWERVESWHGGKWKRFMDQFEEFTAVDDS